MKKRGRVIESTGRWYKVSYDDNHSTKGGTIKCRLPGRFKQKGDMLTNPISVGDMVQFTINDDGSGSIQEIEDRKNYLIRKATSHTERNQILASNIDRAFVVQSIRKPNIKQQFIDRFLVTCEAYQIPAGIIFNKMDLGEDESLNHQQYLTDLYQSLGYRVLHTSIHDDASLEPLKEQLDDNTSVFIGHSGVGKSSLLNKLNPEIDREVAEISSYNEKGTHTTTFAKLLPLLNSGYLVDTPGIREFGLVNFDPWELSLYFPEMLEPRKNCRFNNCTHSHEPGCGVIEAYTEGKIDPERYDSYLKIFESLQDD